MARKAFGPQRRMAPITKARNVARSILQREAAGISWTWADYGLTDGSDQARLVQERLCRPLTPREERTHDAL